MNSPSCRNFHKYDTHELEQMLRDDISNKKPMDVDDILAVLDTLGTKSDGSNGDMLQAHEAWIRFQKYYAPEEPEGSQCL